jgi:hypothetical protein
LIEVKNSFIFIISTYRFSRLFSMRRTVVAMASLLARIICDSCTEDNTQQGISKASTRRTLMDHTPLTRMNDVVKDMILYIL